MNPIYKLHIDGHVFENTAIGNLKRISDNTEQYFEIYVHYRSNMGDARLGFKKMDILDMREAKRMNSRGITMPNIARKFGVSKYYIQKVLTQMIAESF